MAYTSNKKTKYIYERIIQLNHGYGWDDVESIDTNSQFAILPYSRMKEWTDTIKDYRNNSHGRYSIRIIQRKSKR
jgi:hypothetical protein